MDLLNTNNDMDLTNGELTFVTSRDAIGQDIGMRLRTFLGETVYDQRAGVPYLEVIFSRKNPDLQGTQRIFESVVNNTPGVIESQLALEFDSPTRVLTVTGKAETIDGEIDFSELIKAAP